MSRRARETLGSAFGLAVLIAMLMAVDDRLHDRVTRFVNDVFVTHGSGNEQTLLLVFLAVGVVLVLLMLRT